MIPIFDCKFCVFSLIHFKNSKKTQYFNNLRALHLVTGILRASWNSVRDCCLHSRRKKRYLRTLVYEKLSTDWKKVLFFKIFQPYSGSDRQNWSCYSDLCYPRVWGILSWMEALSHRRKKKKTLSTEHQLI